MKTNTIKAFETLKAGRHFNRVVKRLRATLPDWYFEAYGNRGAVACYPVHGPSAEAYGALKTVAFISSVCGPLYVVTTLK